MGAMAIVFGLDVIISTFCMVLAAKLSFVKAQVKPLIAIVIVVSILP